MLIIKFLIIFRWNFNNGDKMKEFKSFYKEVGGGEGDRCKYPIRLDMYGCGCQHDCPYCYAKGLLDFRGLWDKVEPRVADKDKVLRRLDKISSGTVLRLGGMTDPFQPMEKEVGLNRWLIDELNKRGIGYLIVTKGDYLDGYVGDILDKKLAHIQISVTSTKDDLNLEPNAPLPSKRIRCAEALQKMGFDVQLRLSPYIQELIEPDVILNAKVDKVIIEFLRINSRLVKDMPWLDTSRYTVKSGGYYNMELADKLRVIDIYIRSKRVSVCEDVPEHWVYFRDNVNPNKNDCCDLND